MDLDPPITWKGTVLFIRKQRQNGSFCVLLLDLTMLIILDTTWLTVWIQHEKITKTRHENDTNTPIYQNYMHKKRCQNLSIYHFKRDMTREKTRTQHEYTNSRVLFLYVFIVIENCRRIWFFFLHLQYVVTIFGAFWCPQITSA